MVMRNGKGLAIELHADSVDRFTTMIDQLQHQVHIRQEALRQLKDGAITLDQLVVTDNGGFKINPPKPELPKANASAPAQPSQNGKKETAKIG